jgi:hypothetical protein
MTKKVLWAVIVLLLCAMPVFAQDMTPRQGYQEALRRIEAARVSGQIELDLTELELTELPPEIRQLTALQVLYVFHNNLTHLPPEIGQLTALQRLYLYSNQLSSLPLEIGQLAHLQLLDLSYNQLSALPSEFGQLTHLQSLSLNNNQLISLPPEIGLLTKLQSLHLHNNQLTTLPSELGQLTNLQTLYLLDNRLTSLPPEIGQLSSLQELYLLDNHLTNLPPEIGQLISLQSFELPYNQLSGRLFHIDKRGSLSGQRGIELHQPEADIRGLAQRDPENAIIEGLQDVLLMAKGRGERRLAKSARPLQRCCNGHWTLSIGLQQVALQFYQWGCPLNKRSGQIRRHKRRSERRCDCGWLKMDIAIKSLIAEIKITRPNVASNVNSWRG